MGKQIIKQPNGLYCIFSTVVDNVTDYDLTSSEIIDMFVEEEKERITSKVLSITSKLDKGEPAYFNFIIDYNQMLESISRIHGDEEMITVKKLLESEYSDNNVLEYTQEEVRKIFMDKIKSIINYWNNESCNVKDKLEGLTHSILSVIDGSTDLPKFILAPDPHPTDKDYHISKSKRFFPENKSVVSCDISGYLHEIFK